MNVSARKLTEATLATSWCLQKARRVVVREGKAKLGLRSGIGIA